MTMTGSMVSMMRNLIYVQAGVSDTLVISRNRVNNRTLLSEGSWGCLQPSSVYISLSQQRGTRLCSDKFQTFPSVRTTWPPFPSHESRHAQPHMLPHGIIFWLGSLLGEWEICIIIQSHAHTSEGSGDGFSRPGKLFPIQMLLCSTSQATRTDYFTNGNSLIYIIQHSLQLFYVHIYLVV